MCFNQEIHYVMLAQHFLASTPGRICLFGEHQDYLGLPVIAAAISRRVSIDAQPTDQPEIRLALPDIGREERFSTVEFPLRYEQPRDYFRSACNVLYREGLRFTGGINARVTGTIPINAGTSSSSALIITWLNILSQLADKPRVFSAHELAELGYAAEVLEFGEPGGMMDHYATAIGGIIYLESTPEIRIVSFPPTGLGSFVLGDSGEPKNTIGLLRHVKFGMLDVVKKIQAYHPAFDLHKAPLESATDYRHLLTADELSLLRGNLSDRDILREALNILHMTSIDDRYFGALLTRHQDNLREAKRISTPKIDRMLAAALTAGALGGKINGSGGGGCMFAYAPQHPEAVAEAIEQQGGRAHIITVDEGTKVLEGTPEQYGMSNRRAPQQL